MRRNVPAASRSRGATTASFSVATTSVTATATIRQLRRRLGRHLTSAAAPATPRHCRSIRRAWSAATLDRHGDAERRRPRRRSRRAVEQSRGSNVPPASRSRQARRRSFAVIQRVSTNTTVVIAGTLGVTRTANLTLTPPPAPAAPTLVSPANAATVGGAAGDARLERRRQRHELRGPGGQLVDDLGALCGEPDGHRVEVTLGALPAQQLWWRVRARNRRGCSGRSPRRGDSRRRPHPGRPASRR